MNDKGDYRTAPATLGLLHIWKRMSQRLINDSVTTVFIGQLQVVWGRLNIGCLQQQKGGLVVSMGI